MQETASSVVRHIISNFIVKCEKRTKMDVLMVVVGAEDGFEWDPLLGHTTRWVCNMTKKK